MIEELQAGPVRCRFADGELRYLKIGQTELVRRVFFAVRSKTWDTPYPRFVKSKVTKTETSFLIELEAEVERGMTGYDSDASYRWSGKIEGRADGTITFWAAGEPMRDFESNRIGLCVLLGTPETCERPYQLTGADGTKRTGVFPKLVNAPLTFEPNFSQLAYKTSDGREVTVAATGSAGTIFSMEDQRNFGDSSYKAYAPLPYAYPNVKKGERYEEQLTITVSGGASAAKKAAATNTVLTLGEVVPERVFPTIKQGSAPTRIGYHGINHEREKTKAMSPVLWAYYPTEHLFDDDTCWENASCTVPQADTVRSYYPGADLAIDNIKLAPSHPRPAPDPRNASPFGAAWAALCLKYAALAGIRTAEFAMGSGHAARVLNILTPLKGQPLRNVVATSDALVVPVEAFGIGKRIVVINKTGVRQQATLVGLGAGAWKAIELHGQTAPGTQPPAGKVTVRGGRASLNLAPYEVRLLVI